MCFGIEHLMVAREHRRDEWLTWHIAEGHSYYKRSPISPIHLRGLTRMDIYVLVHIRSCTDVSRHEECIDGLDRFHHTNCSGFGALEPCPDKRFVNESIPDFKAWWTHHRWLGMGIPKQHSDLVNVQVVAANSFTHMVTVLQDGVYVDQVLDADRDFCAFCQKIHATDHMYLAPLCHVNPCLEFCSPTDRLCRGCSLTLVARPSNHFQRNTECIVLWCRLFYRELRDDWVSVEIGLKNALAIRFLIDRFNLKLNCICSAVYRVASRISKHLRQKASASCLRTGMNLLLEWMDSLGDEGDDDNASSMSTCV